MFLEKLKSELPDKIFDIKPYNFISFKVLDFLQISFNECHRFLEEEKINKYHNCVGIFYHHFSKLLSSYYFLNYEISCLNLNQNLFEKYFIVNSKTSNWPVNASSIRNNIYQSDPPNANRFFVKQKIAFSLSRLFGIISNSHKVMILPNVGDVSRYDIIKKGIYLKMYPTDVQFEYKEGEQQWKILQKQIKELDFSLCSFFTKNISMTDNFLTLLEKEFFKYYKANRKISVNVDYIITGSLANLESRIIVANAKTQGKTVIHIWHGESIGTIDEPVFGQVDQTYCDYIIGYGKDGCDEMRGMKYNTGLFGEKPEIVPRSSNRVNSIYSTKQIENIDKKKIGKVMYVPTSFSGTNRYGPYRDLNDLAYYFWQESMLLEFQKKFKPIHLVIKAHSKEKISAKKMRNGVRLEKVGYFSTLIDLPDIFIFDYPTSAFTLAAATNKPIIYFDIGLRNISSEALMSIKERCIYVKGTPKDAESMVFGAFQIIGKHCTNMFTPKYSLTKATRFTEDILIDLIKVVGIT